VTRSVAFLALLALAACANAPPLPPPLVITGDTLHAAKLSVVATEAGMREADEHGLLTREQKLTWNAFLAKFKPGYRVAVDMWEAADASADKSKQEQAAAIVGALLVGLTQFTVMLAEVRGDGGVP
jgi:hypothetical protein